MGEHNHLVLFPMLAEGHIIPFLNLAKNLEQCSHGRRHRLIVTLVSTPRNVAKLRRSLSPDSPIRLAELAFSPAAHGLPPDTESTTTLPLELFGPFYAATESLRPSFEQLVSGLMKQEDCKNVCVISDMFLGWTVASARKLGVPHRVFITASAYGSAFNFSLWIHPPVLSNPDGTAAAEIAFVDFPEIRMGRSEVLNMLISQDGLDPTTTFFREQLLLDFQSDGLLMNTAAELEPEGISLWKRLSGLPAVPLGPVISTDSYAPCNEDICIEFLESKPSDSVLYVSFGSQSTVPASEMVELARGLEESGRPFIWVIRPPTEFHGVEEFSSEWLPGGFQERVQQTKQGLLVHRWASQMAILSHRSTGAFFSHCGWSSVLESISHGVPVIGWPMLGDQPLISKMLQEKGVCIEVASGLFGKLDNGAETVKEAIEVVLGDGEKGKNMRRKVVEMKDTLSATMRGEGEGKGSSYLGVEKFLDAVFPENWSETFLMWHVS